MLWACAILLITIFVVGKAYFVSVCAWLHGMRVYYSVAAFILRISCLGSKVLPFGCLFN